MIETSARIGAPAKRRGTLGPVAVTPAGRWMFFVEPGDGLRPELAAQSDVVLHSHGSWVPAPPTRTPNGRVRWEVHPAVAGWRLPDSYAVQGALLDDLAVTGSEPTFAAAFGSDTRPSRRIRSHRHRRLTSGRAA